MLSDQPGHQPGEDDAHGLRPVSSGFTYRPAAEYFRQLRQASPRRYDRRQAQLARQLEAIEAAHLHLPGSSRPARRRPWRRLGQLCRRWLKR
jgi:hypothetical protein